MGQEIINLDHVYVLRVAAGSAVGFARGTPAITIATMLRGRNEDTIVLTLAEAEAVAKAILAHLAEE